jgi:hypothetical protein
MPMKTLICSIIVLTSALSSAETIIKENPNNYYVESTGTFAPSTGSSDSASVINNESSAIPINTESVIEANQIPHLTTPAVQRAVVENEIQQTAPNEQRAEIEKEIQRRQHERDDLLKSPEVETYDQAIRRQEMADGMLKKINKLSSMLLTLPVQTTEQVR